MTREQIERRLGEIREAARGERDDEAHALESELYRDLVREVAGSTGGELGELASLVLESAEIDFKRTYF